MDNQITRKVDENLSKRPRKSYPKACHPCRRRKVRCDNAQPCASCTTRDHPELCFYTLTGAERALLRQRRRRKGPIDQETDLRGRVSRLLQFEQGLCSLDESTCNQPVKTVDGNIPDSATESYLGVGRANSVASGLAPYMIDTGHVHPFESLWQPGSTVQEIAMALPNDAIFSEYKPCSYLGNIKYKR
jgi:hypothetical protein